MPKCPRQHGTIVASIIFGLTFVGAFGITLSAPFSVAEAEARAKPYNESVVAEDQLAAALGKATDEQRNVLIVFGANWCGDCIALDTALIRTKLAQRFIVVKVDVGRFDKNAPVAARFGVPLTQGIPAVAILNPSGKVLLASQAGELASARSMGDAAILAFFANVPQAKVPQAKFPQADGPKK